MRALIAFGLAALLSTSAAAQIRPFDAAPGQKVVTASCLQGMVIAKERQSGPLTSNEVNRVCRIAADCQERMLPSEPVRVKLNITRATPAAVLYCTTVFLSEQQEQHHNMMGIAVYLPAKR